MGPDPSPNCLHLGYQQTTNIIYFKLSFQDILSSIAEKGPQFTYSEYTQLLQLYHRSHVGMDAVVLERRIQRLKDVIEKGQNETIS